MRRQQYGRCGKLQKVLIDLEVTLFLCLLTSSRRPFRALRMRPVRQEAVHSLWSRLFCGPLKMRRVPEESVFGTEYLFCTVEAYFLHRMLPKMRRVPQEAFLSTARIFRTVEACFWYRVLSQRQVAAAAEPGVHFSRPLFCVFAPLQKTRKVCVRVLYLVLYIKY